MSYIKINENDKKIILDGADNITKTFVDPSDADITAADVARDKIAYGADGKVIGTAELVTEGWYYTEDADITTDDVMSGKTAYGAGGKLTGTYVPLDTTDADATAGDIRAGKTAYVDGEKITGTGQMAESPDWFKVTNLDNSRNLVFYIKDASVSLSTSLDNGETWTGYINIIGNWNWTVPAGGTILFDGKINDIWTGRFDGDVSYKVSGNLKTLLKDDPARISFQRLFYSDDNLIDAEDLIIPWRILQENCYESMFQGCRGLITAPRELPAYNVTSQAYISMFNGCTSLTSAPRILGQHFGQTSAWYMFANCTSLTTAPDLPALELEYNCYSNMFNGCTSLTTAPDLPATSLEGAVYESMFSGCSSLTTAPIIGAETVTGGGTFNFMFANTSLNSMPVFNTITIPDGWGCPDVFNYTFTDSNLSGTATAPTTQIASNYGGYRHMFANTNISGLILPNEHVGEGDTYAGIASGCSNLNYVECYAKYKFKWGANDPDTPLDSNDVGNFSDWLNGVAASGTLRVPASMASFYTDNNLVPSGWTLETF